MLKFIPGHILQIQRRAYVPREHGFNNHIHSRTFNRVHRDKPSQRKRLYMFRFANSMHVLVHHQRYLGRDNTPAILGVGSPYSSCSFHFHSIPLPPSRLPMICRKTKGKRALGRYRTVSPREGAHLASHSRVFSRSPPAASAPATHHAISYALSPAPVVPSAYIISARFRRC